MKLSGLISAHLEDTWFYKNGKPKKGHGKGDRWVVRYIDAQTKMQKSAGSFPDGKKGLALKRLDNVAHGKWTREDSEPDDDDGPRRITGKTRVMGSATGAYRGPELSAHYRPHGRNPRAHDHPHMVRLARAGERHT